MSTTSKMFLISNSGIIILFCYFILNELSLFCGNWIPYLHPHASRFINSPLLKTRQLPRAHQYQVTKNFKFLAITIKSKKMRNTFISLGIRNLNLQYHIHMARKKTPALIWLKIFFSGWTSFHMSYYYS